MAVHLPTLETAPYGRGAEGGTAAMRLARLAVELGAASVGGPLTAAEEAIVDSAYRLSPPSAERVEAIRQSVVGGGDPLGDELCAARPASERRDLGAFYTPP